MLTITISMCFQSRVFAQRITDSVMKTTVENV
uniref:Uncharacterized protein n=1 Tax=Arundo donax TaxID=35708 RepID=A0A0A8ZUE7_ARUDO